MTSFLDASSALAAASGGFLCLAADFVMRRRLKSEKRAEELNRAADMLEIHNMHLVSFLNDSAAPDLLKDLLVDFGDAISSEHAAHEYACRLTDRRNSEISEATKPILLLIGELRKHRVDLAQNFELAVSTGVIAMLLRWPETARVFEQAMSQVATEPGRDIGFATRIVGSQRSRAPAISARQEREPAFA